MIKVFKTSTVTALRCTSCGGMKIIETTSPDLVYQLTREFTNKHKEKEERNVSSL